MDWMNIARYFYLTDERLQQISRDFAADMERALCGQPGATVSALKSHVSLPGGEERGVYLALDFGGTNARAARIRLLGRHCYLIEKKVCQPLRLPGQYDYLSSATTARRRRLGSFSISWPASSVRLPMGSRPIPWAIPFPLL